jgi:hypothetical protein
MFKYFLIIAIALLSSCGGKLFSPGLDGALEACSVNGGVRMIYSNMTSWAVVVECNNGAEFEVKDSLPK